jgi:hypothetical protein
MLGMRSILNDWMAFNWDVPKMRLEEGTVLNENRTTESAKEFVSSLEPVIRVETPPAEIF